ncbi:GbsR/MarR family transcriptional regulator [Radiobacillus kanasensis]|uniref:GbsR/MarR family transcriptional regulator n=1 Tax=Radiobacillus kanasensis TaxID=2844358 RepID=UPI001E2A62A7|nr:GbsR/MarR family transcriptional regulator [Radiobacillus kanasensis]UFU00476.1 GbsR/MarR family transcriptional regulator [Radiobacillus kanasensis]
MTNQEKSKDWATREAAVEKFIQVIAKNMNLYGITTSVGRLYGALYFAEQPMTLDDMRDALEMSKTSMSTGVRSLAEMRMVEPAYKKGVRKDLYKSEEDWYKSFTSLFGNRWRHHTESNIEEADQTIVELEMLKNQTTDEMLIEKLEDDLYRLKYAQNYYKWLMRFIEVVESGKIFEYIPKQEEE